MRHVLKSIFITMILCTTLVLLGCPGQSIQGTEPKSPATVIFGYVQDAKGVRSAGHWVDGDWQRYEAESGSELNSGFAIGDDVYAVGELIGLGGVLQAVLWKNGAASKLGTPQDAIGSYAQVAIATAGGKVAVGGQIVALVGGNQTVASGYWLDGTWKALELPSGMTSVTGKGIAEKDGDILMCGYGDNTAYIWKNGTLDSTLALPAGAAKGRALALAIHGGEVYCAGYAIDSADSAKRTACVWKQTEPTLLDSTAKVSVARSILFEDGQPVITGYCADSIYAAYQPVYWKSGAFAELALAEGATSAYSYGKITGEDLYFGYSSDAKVSMQPGYWVKGSWKALAFPDDAVCGLASSGLVLNSGKPPATPRVSPRLAILTAGVLTGARPIMDANGTLIYKDSVGAATVTAVSTNSILLSGQDLYFAGCFLDTGSKHMPAFWKNGQITGISVPDNPNTSGQGEATGIAVSGSSVFVSGYYISAVFMSLSKDYAEIPFIWKDGTRTDLPVLDTAVSGRALKVALLGEDVYVAGYSVKVDGANLREATWTLCYWKNGERFDLEDVAGWDVPLPCSVFTFGSDGTKTKVTLGLGEATSARISSLFVDSQSVYATGACYTASEGWKPCLWKDGVMTELECSDVYPVDLCYQAGSSIIVDGSTSYVAGMRIAGNSIVPALWKDGALVPMDSSLSGYGYLFDMAAYRF